MSDRARSGKDSRPEVAAFEELETLVHRLGEELASFRRRALQAEAQLKQFNASATGAKPTPERLAALERENRDLRQRLAKATDRTQRMLDRVRFLREQQQHSQAGGA